MSNKVRVRFAPRPTGPLHIGGVRTALFNYLFAKQNNGDFVLRIEDTDQNRYVEGAEAYINDSLNWCGIPFDEGPGKERNFGPYRQSERKDLYKVYADLLIQEGKAYYAFDSAESLDGHRKDHEAKGKSFIYNWHNRLKLNNSLVLDAAAVEQKINSGEKYVIRFKSPQDETLIFHDEIRGEIQIDTNILDDKILFKSDGMPTYHLANIVDDHLMEITHVIRGEEWLPSLALHVLLYRAFGWESPKFAHLPLILKPTGKGKLGKRDGIKGGFPVFPMEWQTEEVTSRGFKEDGYLPEAVVNFLAFLGWNPGTEQEIFSLDELIKDFNLKKVNKAGAKFDPEKAKWFNQQYIAKLDDADLTTMFLTLYPEMEKEQFNRDYIAKAVSLMKERVVFVNDLKELTDFFYNTPETYDEKAFKKAIKEDTASLMRDLSETIQNISDFSAGNLQDKIKGWITSKEIGFGKVMQPLRLSLVGAMKGPDVFEIISLLGKKESIARIEKLINSI